jgi:S1/P1 Nuclease
MSTLRFRMQIANRPRTNALVAAFVLLVASNVNALAWGYEGHRIVAEIAEQFLEPETAHHVRDLLAIENRTTLAEVSTWADEIRPQYPETRRWHFVSIPIHPPAGDPSGYDAARDCPQHNCVVARLEEFERVLADPQASGRQRLEALKYVVHFIGDVHQPLHASNNNDRGGNDVAVTFMGQQTNLHAVWDSGIIGPAVKGDERAYALRLAGDITPAERQQWSAGSAVSWANESYGIAVRMIYGQLPHTGTLPDGYETEALPIVNQQLRRAGVRLAMVLNTCLK